MESGTESPKKKLYDPEAEQLARLERMDQVCSRPYTLGDDSYPSLWTRDEQQSYQVLATDHIFTHHVLVDHAHKSLYCYVPKVSMLMRMRQLH